MCLGIASILREIKACFKEAAVSVTAEWPQGGSPSTHMVVDLA